MTNKHEDMNRILKYINYCGLTKTFETDSYDDIDNVTFHKLRVAYLKAQERLVNYVIKHSDRNTDADKF